jgi:hypothetical protein
VPAGTATTISTDGGDATVTGTTGDVTLSSGGGNVTADHAAGDLTLTTDGGDINGTALTAARVTASTGGGDVQIEFATVPGNVGPHPESHDHETLLLWRPRVFVIMKSSMITKASGHVADTLLAAWEAPGSRW